MTSTTTAAVMPDSQKVQRRSLKYHRSTSYLSNLVKHRLLGSLSSSIDSGHTSEWIGHHNKSYLIYNAAHFRL